jgi:anaerobic magnesium-protoporphyrin IX monomethyl ester cyclase
MPNVLLLTTPETPTFTSNFGYPIGLMYIASYLRKHTNCEVRIIDLKITKLNKDELLHTIRENSYQYIGISGMSFESESINSLTKNIKAELPDTKIIIGGPYASCEDYHDILKNKSIDYIVKGEGEEVFEKLITAIENGNPTPTIPGLIYKKNGKTTIHDNIIPSQPLDNYPFPAWDLINIEKYHKKRQSLFYKYKRQMTIVTSRGCPYQCIYCHSIFGKKHRTRSAENVFKEIEYLYKTYNIQEFYIADDGFNLDIARAEKICDLIIESNIKIGILFPNGLRADRMEVSLLQKMKKAGVFYIGYSVETASKRLQKYIKKNNDLDKLLYIVEETAKLNIFTRGYFMLGFPTETISEIKETINFSLKAKFHATTFFIVTPNPGTELFDITKQKIPSHKKDIKSFHYHNALGYSISEVPDDKIQKLRQKAILLHMLNPTQLLRTLKVLFIICGFNIFPQIFRAFKINFTVFIHRYKENKCQK